MITVERALRELADVRSQLEEHDADPLRKIVVDLAESLVRVHGHLHAAHCRVALLEARVAILEKLERGENGSARSGAGAHP